MFQNELSRLLEVVSLFIIVVAFPVAILVSAIIIGTV